MKIGEIEELNINGIRLRMRYEEQGYYCYVPTYGKLICFNLIGFQILKLLSKGYKRDEIVEIISKQYSKDKVILKNHINYFFVFLQDLRLQLFI